MTSKPFTQAEKEILLQNPNILRVGKKYVTYAPQFKVKVMEAEMSQVPDKTGFAVFIEEGINIEILSLKRVKGSIFNWSKLVAEKGIEALALDERKTRRKAPSNPNSAEQLKKALAINELYRVRDRFIEKQEGKGVFKTWDMIPTNLVFSFIQDLAKKFGRGYIGLLCQEAGVNRRAYYRYLKKAEQGKG